MRTTTRKLACVLSVLSLMPGCLGKEVAECIGTAIGSALGRAIGVGVYEGTLPIDRPDDVRPTAPVWVGGVHEGGRLVLTMDGPVVSGTLPRHLNDGGCESVGDFAYLYRRDGGATEVLSATLTVTQQARTDGGIPTLFRFTGVSATLPDGGRRPVSDRDLNLLVP